MAAQVWKRQSGPKSFRVDLMVNRMEKVTTTKKLFVEVKWPKKNKFLPRSVRDFTTEQSADEKELSVCWNELFTQNVQLAPGDINSPKPCHVAFTVYDEPKSEGSIYATGLLNISEYYSEAVDSVAHIAVPLAQTDSVEPSPLLRLRLNIYETASALKTEWRKVKKSLGTCMGATRVCGEAKAKESVVTAESELVAPKAYVIEQPASLDETIVETVSREAAVAETASPKPNLLDLMDVPKSDLIEPVETAAPKFDMSVAEGTQRLAEQELEKADKVWKRQSVPKSFRIELMVNRMEKVTTAKKLFVELKWSTKTTFLPRFEREFTTEQSADEKDLSIHWNQLFRRTVQLAPGSIKGLKPCHVAFTVYDGSKSEGSIYATGLLNISEYYSEALDSVVHIAVPLARTSARADSVEPSPLLRLRLNVYETASALKTGWRKVKKSLGSCMGATKVRGEAEAKESVATAESELVAPKAYVIETPDTSEVTTVETAETDLVIPKADVIEPSPTFEGTTADTAKPGIVVPKAGVIEPSATFDGMMIETASHEAAVVAMAEPKPALSDLVDVPNANLTEQVGTAALEVDTSMDEQTQQLAEQAVITATPQAATAVMMAAPDAATATPQVATDLPVNSPASAETSRKYLTRTKVSIEMKKLIEEAEVHIAKLARRLAEKREETEILSKQMDHLGMLVTSMLACLEKPETNGTCDMVPIFTESERKFKSTGFQESETVFKEREEADLALGDQKGLEEKDESAVTEPKEEEQEAEAEAEPALTAQKETPGRNVILYTTGLGCVRSVFEDCNRVRNWLKEASVSYTEKDVAYSVSLRNEMHKLIGFGAPPPRLFIDDLYVGGIEEIEELIDMGSFQMMFRK